MTDPVAPMPWKSPDFSERKRRTLGLAHEYLIPGRVETFVGLGIPLVIGRRDGYRFWDVDGHELMDFHLNGGTYNLGHRHPALVQALEEALRTLDIGNHHFPSEARAELAVKLAACTPGDLHYTVFASGGSEAVDVAIEGPPGTRIWWSRGQSTHETSISADGAAQIRLLEPAEPDANEGNAFSPSVTLVTPAGHAYHASWRIRIYRQPPDLGMDEEVPLIDFAPSVTGRTLPGSTISVNGQPGEVGADGSFSVPVQVGFVPTEVRIVVTDLVGNRTERLITRVWPLDYRQLPWVPIAVLLTVAAAALLFLRQPESRPGRRLTPDDESTFEEIGG